MMNKLKFFIFIISLYIGYSQNIHINKIIELKNIEVIYNLPDYLHPKIIIYSDSIKSRIISEYNILGDIFQPSKYLKEKDWEKEWKMDGRTPHIMKKQFNEVKKLKNYYISTYYEHTCCHNKYDILIWKKEGNKISLNSLYPEYVGGCLYCGTVLKINNDTLVFETMGGDAGDFYGGKSFFKIKSGKLLLCKSESFDGYDLDNDFHKITKIKYYDDNEEIVKSTIDFEKKKNEQPVFKITNQDSLLLYEATVKFPEYKPKYVQKIYIPEKTIRIGPARGKQVPIFWKGKWYITYIKYLKFKK